MLRSAEKCGFLPEAMVEVRKDNEATTVLSRKFSYFRQLWEQKLCEKTKNGCNFTMDLVD